MQFNGVIISWETLLASKLSILFYVLSVLTCLRLVKSLMLRMKHSLLLKIKALRVISRKREVFSY